LKQTKNFALLDKRYALIQYFLQHFTGSWEVKPDRETLMEFLIQTCNISLLFDDCVQFFDVAEALFNYYSKGDPLPDYRGKYPHLDNINYAFFEHATQGLLILQNQLESSKHARVKIRLIKKP
jgi:hypothetical protein